MKTYYHLFANGSDAKNFITNINEMKTAFNRVGLCSSLTDATVVSFSIEDSHPHILLWGEYKECVRFKKYYEDISLRCIARKRGSLDGVKLHCELYEVTDPAYLRNVAAYTIIQATKDGKAIMPYDYLFGSGALYFRSAPFTLPWQFNEYGEIIQPVQFKELTAREKQKICGSTSFIPDNWLVCNGFILPNNYVDVKRFESIYVTHNCFRVFLASSKEKNKVVLDKMASIRGIMLEDLEARKICESMCMTLFKRKGTRHITPEQRIILSRELSSKYGISIRQLATLTKIPEDELRKYLR